MLLPVILSTFVTLSNGCPDLCRCQVRGRVYCNGKGLTQVPYGIPSDTKVLYLQDNEIINSVELNERLSNLPILEKVMLYKNELTEMPVIKSDSLLKLELAENKIHTIKEGSFLPKLDSLNLDDNHLTNGGISFGAFDGIGSLRTLTLNKNDLSAFPAGLPSSLNTLHLEENKITEFPIESVQHLSQLRELQVQRNKVNDQSFPGNVFGYWIELKDLDMSLNRLTKFPRDLQPSLETLRLSSNQMVYLTRHDFAGLSSLRTLDLSYNRLRAIEDGSLESLQSLQEIDLSGNNWSCDCYSKPLKDFLDNFPYHKGMREDLVCGGTKSSGQNMDRLNSDRMTCDDIKFNITNIDSEKATATVTWDQPDLAPPFVQFRLRFSRVTLNGVEDIKEMTVVSPLEHRLRDLRAGETYRVCLYNEYYLGMDYEQNFCKEFELISNEANLNIAEVYEEVVIPAQNDDLETIIGLLTGALIVILSLIIVAVLFWRSNRYSNDKNRTLPPAGNTYNSKYEHQYQFGSYTTDTRCPMYPGPPPQNFTTYAPTTQTMESAQLNTFQLNHQTVDAGSEFAVALVPTNSDGQPINSSQPVMTPQINGTNNNYANRVTASGVFV